MLYYLSFVKLRPCEGLGVVPLCARLLALNQNSNNDATIVDQKVTSIKELMPTAHTPLKTSQVSTLECERAGRGVVCFKE